MRFLSNKLYLQALVRGLWSKRQYHRNMTNNMYEESREIIEPYNLPYSDLISLSSSSLSLSSSDENRRLEVISTAVMEALGPTGPGLLAITDVPNAVVLRNTLLPLARDLALLPSDLRNRILMAHGLGSDVPLKNLDRCVSSFAMQLKYGDDLVPSKPTSVNFDVPVKDDGFSEKLNHHFMDLSSSFRELGLCMMDMGLRVARICDKAIGGRELEKSLLESGAAKGRLIQYHSCLDTRIIKEYAGKSGSRKRQPKSKNGILLNSKDTKSSKTSELTQLKGSAGRACEKVSELWQQWHYDYGTFTVLTSPMFTRPKISQDEDEEDGSASMNFGGLECPSPSGHTYLQIIHPNNDNICIVKVPPESFILQVGESANILSRNKLQSTLHSVLRPVELESLSRETFVVFLHPAWNKAFDLSEYPTEELTSNCHQEQNFGGNKDGVKKLKEEIHKIIPPLSSRLKDGMTFAEFSRQTTKQYYGGNGFQANR